MLRIFLRIKISKKKLFNTSKLLKKKPTKKSAHVATLLPIKSIVDFQSVVVKPTRALKGIENPTLTLIDLIHYQLNNLEMYLYINNK